MHIIELTAIAVALSMDAFAVSIAKGLSVPKLRFKEPALAGIYFGSFQALMPILGYFAASYFRTWIENFDHWIAFTLLGLIGFNMIRESFEKDKTENQDFGPRAMFPLAIATSIDALAIGISFSLLQVKIFTAAGFIGILTFLFSAVGVIIGNKIGCKCRTAAERLGGVILIVIGCKILIEHLLS